MIGDPVLHLQMNVFLSDFQWCSGLEVELDGGDCWHFWFKMLCLQVSCLHIYTQFVIDRVWSFAETNVAIGFEILIPWQLSIDIVITIRIASHRRSDSSRTLRLAVWNIRSRDVLHTVLDLLEQHRHRTAVHRRIVVQRENSLL